MPAATPTMSLFSSILATPTFNFTGVAHLGPSNMPGLQPAAQARPSIAHLPDLGDDSMMAPTRCLDSPVKLGGRSRESTPGGALGMLTPAFVPAAAQSLELMRMSFLQDEQ
jgi:hypothetical protein